MLGREPGEALGDLVAIGGGRGGIRILAAVRLEQANGRDRGPTPAAPRDTPRGQ
jgi:hypothetical protein